MNRFISIKVILDRILRHPLMQDLQYDAAVDYTIDFMRIVGSPKMFVENIEKVEVNDYRADLSGLNIYKIIGVRQGDRYFKYVDNSFHPALFYSGSPIPVMASVPPITETLPEFEDIFSYMCTFEFVSKMNAYYINNSNNIPTYKILGSCIFTSIEKGEIEVAYIGIQKDSDGFPMIIDNSSYLRALELYIKKQWFTILFDMGKVAAPVLLNVQQEYAWAVGDCESEFNRMTLDQAKYFYNTMKNIHNESYGFNYMGG